MKKSDNYKIGDKIKVISFPRKIDNADGFAGIKGEIISLNFKKRFSFFEKGYIRLKLENGGSFFGVGINRLKAEKIT